MLFGRGRAAPPVRSSYARDRIVTSSPKAGSRFLLPLALLGAGLVAGCGGGGGGGDAAAAGTGGSQTPAPGDLFVRGAITFDLVPVVLETGGPRLDYAATEVRPARGVTVQAVDGDDTVLATATTDAAGRYTLPLAADLDGIRIVARAEMLRAGLPSWDFRVVDNTQSDALYVLESAELSTGSVDLTRDLHAASGWDGLAYAEPRSAAPFAILDVVYEAVGSIEAATPTTAFPPLVLHWSPDNVPSRPDSGLPDFASGEIGSSLFMPGFGVFILGSVDSDTDEYDRHVIAHEWAHYLEHALARSDSIGGPHTRGDQLDLRTAFSEGFANAFSAIALGDTVYKDTLGPEQSLGFAFDVEGPFYPSHSATSANPHPGWFSEESIQELIYDLFDDSLDVDEDVLAFGAAPLLAALAGPVRESTALVSVFPFVRAVKAAFPAEEAQIDALVALHDIDPVTDDFGAGEDNAGTPTNGGTGDVLPVYKEIIVNDAAPVEVCSTDDYRSGATGSVNKLGSRAFLRFKVASPGRHTFSAVTTEMPEGETADPDMALHRRGFLTLSDGEPDEALCTVDNPAGCVEEFSRDLSPDDPDDYYVLEVYEWTNITTDSEYPPIGRTCFAVSITR